MSNKNILYWSCNEQKYVRIVSSRSRSYVERLGFQLDTEWHLEIGASSELGNFQTESTFSKGKSTFVRKHFSHLHFHLKRIDTSKKITVRVNVFSDKFTVDSANLYYYREEESVLIGTLDLEKSGVCFHLSFVFEIYPRNKSKSNENHLSKLENMSGDFLSMLDKGNHYDVTLICDTEVVRAHKNILSARSPVFKAMFNIDMTETDKNEVIIKDMNPSVLRALVYFIYSGQIKDLNFRSAKELLDASERYQIVALKQGCIEYLQSILANENVFEILEMGDLYDESLMSNSIQYVCKHFNELKTTEQWKIFKIKKPLLALKVYSSLEPYFELKI